MYKRAAPVEVKGQRAWVPLDLELQVLVSQEQGILTTRDLYLLHSRPILSYANILTWERPPRTQRGHVNPVLAAIVTLNEFQSLKEKLPRDSSSLALV